MARKSKLETLLAIDICYEYTGVHPNIFEVNNEGINISRPHIEIRKLARHPSKRVFTVNIKKPGLYKFTNLNVPKWDKLYKVFGCATSGIILIKDNKEVFLLEVDKKTP